MTVPKLIIHNETLGNLIKHDEYKKTDVQKIWDLLNQHNSLNFPTIEGRGLFKAALTVGDQSTEYTGYENVWVRDNIHVAHAHLVMGDAKACAATLHDIVSFWFKYKNRWIDCILGKVDYNEDVMLRPHIRFNGTELKENEQRWSHAQNDAIGYFTWLYCKLARNDQLVGEFNAEMLVLICLYHLAIGYWKDLDNGHWEEARKIESSSIGAAAAGYKELEALLAEKPAVLENFKAEYAKALSTLNLKETPLSQKALFGLESANGLVTYLAKVGLETLNRILPFECREEESVRETDGALVFLVYPLQIVQGDLARKVLEDVAGQLAGDHGIRRYLGDSYWMANYKNLFSEENRTADFSDDMSARDSLLKAGQEAQWCIFDSIISCSYGLEYKKAVASGTASKEELDALKLKQVLFFNRAVGQVTGDDCHFGPWLCPESYYIENSANGKYVVNDVCPLLWTQANLINALQIMIDTSE